MLLTLRYEALVNCSLNTVQFKQAGFSKEYYDKNYYDKNDDKKIPSATSAGQKK